jgi:methyl-accepting chemotaxis protein
LDNIVIDMNSFRRGTQQAIKEGMEEIAGQSMEQLAKIGDHAGGVAERAVIKIDEAFDSFSRNAKRLDEVSDETVTAMEALIERLKSIEAPADLLEKKLEPALESITEAVDTVREMTKEDQEQVSRLSRTLDRAIESAQLMDSRVAVLNEQMGPLEQVVTGILEMGESLRNIHGDVEGAVRGIKEGIEAQGSALTRGWAAAQKESQEAMKNFIEELHRQAETVGPLLLNAHYNTEAMLNRARANFEQQVRVLTDLFSTVEASLNTVRKHNQELEAELGRSREMTAKVQAALTSMAVLLVEKLGEPASEQVTKRGKRSQA